MGLDIHARSTNGHIGWPYSRIHRTIRYLALRYSGMPEYLDNDKTIKSIAIYMHPFFEGKKIDTPTMQSFLTSIQFAVIHFPNILMHSDCSGTYTKNGRAGVSCDLSTGNSKQLLKELAILVNEPVFKVQKYENEYSHLIKFFALVKNEVENGKGRIEFS